MLDRANVIRAVSALFIVGLVIGMIYVAVKLHDAVYSKNAMIGMGTGLTGFVFVAVTAGLLGQEKGY